MGAGPFGAGSLLIAAKLVPTWFLPLPPPVTATPPAAGVQAIRAARPLLTALRQAGPLLTQLSGVASLLRLTRRSPPTLQD
jgi:hypothetical protein